MPTAAGVVAVAVVTAVGKPHPETNLYDPPGPYGGVGRPPAEGARRAEPSQASGPDARRDELTVDRYGGGKRRVCVAGEAAYCFRSGRGLVEMRWVGVRDRTGTHRDEHLDATDPAQIVGDSSGRWSVKAFSDALACVRRRTRCEGFCDRPGAGRVSRNSRSRSANSC